MEEPSPLQTTFASRLRTRLTSLSPRCRCCCSGARLRNRILIRLSRNPITISYLLLIAPLSFIASYPLFTRAYHNDTPRGLYLLILFAALSQPKGSLLLAPATNPGRLYRLNPLVCLAEALVTVFRLAVLKTVGDKGLSWVGAARVLVYERESVDVGREDVKELAEEGSSKGYGYSEVRGSLGFPPLRTRGLDSSATISIFVIFLLTRNFHNNSAAGITTLTLLYLISFAALQATILIASSRELPPEEESAVDDEIREYFLAHLLRPEGLSNIKAKIGVDDGVPRFLGVVALCWAVGFAYLGTTWAQGFNGIGAVWIMICYPAGLGVCFGLLRATRLGGRKSEVLHLLVEVVALVLLQYWTR
ncbi:hypothetical protein FGG08_004399 [Glutinoglossum americanum]|uniref:Uncharacterized protein n=1 Tax=Glutinoglossum americanum TaxID=1670608 RepID=A0A9P8KZL6_9PEZI|nr:hypothetical protein FGG08_004399 [Glutinoglossum americanum]